MVGVDLFDPSTVCSQQPDVFFSRSDPNDIRLGDLVSHTRYAYAKCAWTILGYPVDEGVRRNGGRTGSAQAPADIRRWLYRLTVNRLAALHLYDLGDTAPQSTLEATHALHQRIVSQVIADGKGLIVLGGGNDVAYPDAAGLAHAAGPIAAFNIDAHFDVRADMPCNSGTPYRQLLDGHVLSPGRFFEIGFQPFANSPVYEQYLRQAGVHLASRQDIRDDGITAVVRRALAGADAPSLFWGFDLDVVRAADAPGVSAPNPTGISGDDLCAAAELAGADPRTRLVEFSEANPAYDADHRTSRLTAAAIWHFLSQAGRNPH